MENQKITAVEWLVEELNIDIEFRLKNLKEVLEQAKEMEKEQIIDAYQNGGIDGQVFALTRKRNIENGEQYYNETFNK